MICDFCLGPDVAWDYPTAPITDTQHPVFTVLAGDGFAACESCHRALVLGDYEGLVWRIAAYQPVHVPEGTVVEGGVVVYGPLEVQLTKARFAVLRFLEARTGPPTRM